MLRVGKCAQLIITKRKTGCVGVGRGCVTDNNPTSEENGSVAFNIARLSSSGTPVVPPSTFKSVFRGVIGDSPANNTGGSVPAFNIPR